MGDVYRQDAGEQTSVAVLADVVGENESDVGGGMFFDAAELARVKEVVGDAIKLQSISDDFSEEFTYCFEQGDWSVGFGDGVVVLFGLWDDDRARIFMTKRGATTAQGL